MDEMHDQPECFQTIRAMLGADDTLPIRPQAPAQPHHQPSIRLIRQDIRRVNSALLTHLPAQLGLPTTELPDTSQRAIPVVLDPTYCRPKEPEM